MKSDKKMVEDILMKVAEQKEQKKHQKKLVVKTLSVTFAFIFVLVAGVSVYDNGIAPSVNEDNTLTENMNEPVINKAFSLIVASAAENTDAVAIHKETDISIPFGGLLYVRNTENMSTGEINRIAYDVECKLQELYGDNENWSVTGMEGDVAVYFGTIDYLSLVVADADDVEEITVSCGVNGKLMIYDKTQLGNIKEFHKTIKAGKEICVSGEEYKNLYGRTDGMILRWSPSEELQEFFCADPAFSLSDVKDELVGVIHYVDGTEESFIINLSFDDIGILNADYSYNN